MTLVVEAPPGRTAERSYILEVVLSERLGLQWRLEQLDRPDVRIRLDGDPDGPALTLPDTLLATPDDAWLTPATLPATPLPVLAVDDPGSTALLRGQRIPVFYGAPGALVEHGPDGARLAVDVFGSAFFVLTRYEEVVRTDRDEHDRFPAAAALSGHAGLLREPVVDVWVEVLWSALERLWPRLRRRGRGYQVLLSHDVDDPLALLGRRPPDVARQFAADLLLRRDPGLAARRARALLSRRDHRGDPHDTFDLLMDVSERHGLVSAFYFQSHRRADPAAGALYAVGDPWFGRLIRRMHERGHEIGYHAGFGTYRDARRTAAEFGHLREVAERAGVRQDRWGGRQHYLQWAAPQTWRNWDGAGLDYDCTLAHADAVGFRTGTCHGFRTFDLTAGRALELREQPFQVMDVTLFDYMSLSPDAAADAVAGIAAECRRYSGSLGLLWHNDSLRTTREKRWYSALVAAVTSAV